MIEALVLVAIWYVIGLLIVTRWIRRAATRRDPRVEPVRNAPPHVFICSAMLVATTAPAVALWLLIRGRSG